MTASTERSPTVTCILSKEDGSFRKLEMAVLARVLVSETVVDTDVRYVDFADLADYIHQNTARGLYLEISAWGALFGVAKRRRCGFTPAAPI